MLDTVIQDNESKPHFGPRISNEVKGDVTRRLRCEIETAGDNRVGVKGGKTILRKPTKFNKA